MDQVAPRPEALHNPVVSPKVAIEPKKPTPKR
jgi:hypothetical protein